MAGNSKTDKTPDNVAEMATQSHALTRGRTDLIGLFGAQDQMSALIRTPGGSIQRVSVGETLSIGRVVAIDDKGIMVTKNGQNRRLTLPAG